MLRNDLSVLDGTYVGTTNGLKISRVSPDLSGEKNPFDGELKHVFTNSNEHQKLKELGWLNPRKYFNMKQKGLI